MPTTSLLAIQAQAAAIADAYVPTDGRPPVIARDSDKVELLLASLHDGNYREVACKVSGFPVATFYATLKRAESGDPGAILFREAVEKAEALAEADSVHHIRAAGRLPQFWAASMTHLERRHPDRWARRQDDASTPRVVVQIGSNAGDVAVTVAVSSHTGCDDRLENPNETAPLQACVPLGVLDR
jgi:hypothetical protein